MDALQIATGLCNSYSETNQCTGHGSCLQSPNLNMTFYNEVAPFYDHSSTMYAEIVSCSCDFGWTGKDLYWNFWPWECHINIVAKRILAAVAAGVMLALCILYGYRISRWYLDRRKANVTLLLSVVIPGQRRAGLTLQETNNVIGFWFIGLFGGFCFLILHILEFVGIQEDWMVCPFNQIIHCRSEHQHLPYPFVTNQRLLMTGGLGSYWFCSFSLLKKYFKIISSPVMSAPNLKYVNALGILSCALIITSLITPYFIPTPYHTNTIGLWTAKSIDSNYFIMALFSVLALNVFGIGVPLVWAMYKMERMLQGTIERRTKATQSLGSGLEVDWKLSDPDAETTSGGNPDMEMTDMASSPELSSIDLNCRESFGVGIGIECAERDNSGDDCYDETVINDEDLENTEDDGQAEDEELVQLRPRNSCLVGRPATPTLSSRRYVQFWAHNTESECSTDTDVGPMRPPSIRYSQNSGSSSNWNDPFSLMTRLCNGAQSSIGAIERKDARSSAHASSLPPQQRPQLPQGEDDDSLRLPSKPTKKSKYGMAPVSHEVLHDVISLSDFEYGSSSGSSRNSQSNRNSGHHRHLAQVHEDEEVEMSHINLSHVDAMWENRLDMLDEGDGNSNDFEKDSNVTIGSNALLEVAQNPRSSIEQQLVGRDVLLPLIRKPHPHIQINTAIVAFNRLADPGVEVLAQSRHANSSTSLDKISSATTPTSAPWTATSSFTRTLDSIRRTVGANLPASQGVNIIYPLPNVQGNVAQSAFPLSVNPSLAPILHHTLLLRTITIFFIIAGLAGCIFLISCEFPRKYMWAVEPIMTMSMGIQGALGGVLVKGRRERK